MIIVGDTWEEYDLTIKFIVIIYWSQGILNCRFVVDMFYLKLMGILIETIFFNG
jgi:hypothetical protein